MEKVNRNVCRNLLLAATCALFGFALSAHAQSAVEKALLAKAQSLAASGHLDMAAQTWQQVLLADPNNREALSGIAKADMQLGKTDEARMYLERLRAAGGNAADIAKIQGYAGRGAEECATEPGWQSRAKWQICRRYAYLP